MGADASRLERLGWSRGWRSSAKQVRQLYADIGAWASGAVSTSASPGQTTASPRKVPYADRSGNQRHLWGYQNDTSDVVYLGGGTRQEQLEKLADQFLLGDPETINAALFCKDASGILSRMEAQH